MSQCGLELGREINQASGFKLMFNMEHQLFREIATFSEGGQNHA